MDEICHKLKKIEIMDKFAMDRAITRMTYQIIEKSRSCRYSLNWNISKRL